MKPGNRKKKQPDAKPLGLVKEQEQTIVNDFTRRTPYASYRPVEYQLYAPLLTFQKPLDDYLEKLFAGDIDDANGNVLDNLIGDMARMALLDLDRQRVRHGDVLRDLAIRNDADRSAFQSAKARVQQQLEETNETIRDLQGRLDHSDSRKGA